MSSSSRQNTTQNQNQSFNNRSTTDWGYMTPPDTPDLQRLRGQEFGVDPSIPHRFASARTRLRESLDNPIGGYYTPQMRDAIVRSGEGRLMQDESQAYREGAFDVNRQNYARNLAVAGMTLPQLTQQGSTSSGTGTMQGTGTAQTSGSPWASVGSIAGGIGGALAPASL